MTVHGFRILLMESRVIIVFNYKQDIKFVFEMKNYFSDFLQQIREWFISLVSKPSVA